MFQTTVILASGGFITNNILTNLINFLAPVIGIALVIYCVIQGLKIATGNENASVKKMVSGVLIILFILGVMYAAGSFESYGKLFKNVSNTAIEKTAKDGNSIIGGGGAE